MLADRVRDRLRLVVDSETRMNVVDMGLIRDLSARESGEVTLKEHLGDKIEVEIQDFMLVHGKGGQPGPRCGTTISQITARQRLTNFCRRCQTQPVL